MNCHRAVGGEEVQRDVRREAARLQQVLDAHRQLLGRAAELRVALAVAAQEGPGQRACRMARTACARVGGCVKSARVCVGVRMCMCMCGNCECAVP